MMNGRSLKPKRPEGNSGLFGLQEVFLLWESDGPMIAVMGRSYQTHGEFEND
jgi:hypothetical protein